MAILAIFVKNRNTNFEVSKREEWVSESQTLTFAHLNNNQEWYSPQKKLVSNIYFDNFILTFTWNLSHKIALLNPVLIQWGLNNNITVIWQMNFKRIFWAKSYNL